MAAMSRVLGCRPQLHRLKRRRNRVDTLIRKVENRLTLKIADSDGLAMVSASPDEAPHPMKPDETRDQNPTSLK